MAQCSGSTTSDAAQCTVHLPSSMNSRMGVGSRSFLSDDTANSSRSAVTRLAVKWACTLIGLFVCGRVTIEPQSNAALTCVAVFHREVLQIILKTAARSSP